MSLDFNPSSNDARSMLISRLFVLFATMVCGLFLTVAAASIIGDASTARLRIATLFQDILLFIAPAVVTALMSSRMPARFLSIDRGFSLKALIAAVVVMIVSVPLQNAIIQWNASLSLPEALTGVDRWMKETEATMQHHTALLLGGTTVKDLIAGLLIVGVFAALSEELFFRGALQRILQGSKTSAHSAIWIGAVIFSAFHMQFLGFVPRMLLGALFGYLVWWSGSLWLPVIVHALNNSMVVTTQWRARCLGVESTADTFGADSPLLIAASAVLTVGAIILLRRVCLGQKISAASSGESERNSSSNP